MSGTLVMVGASHHSSPLEVRERLDFESAGWYAEAGPRLPSVLLATCNRVEVYAWAPDEDRTTRVTTRLTSAFARVVGMDVHGLQAHLTTRSGEEALLHLVRVAAGLDSQVVGEEQIRGQLRAAVDEARTRAPLGASLEGVMRRALEAARRIRGSSPRLGQHPSVAAAGVAVALRQPALATGVNGRSVVVLGAGAMARAASLALVQSGAVVTICNRTRPHGERLAAELPLGSAVVAPWADLPRLLQDADLLVGATAARQPVVAPELLAERGGRPLVALDIALPRDVDPRVRSLEGVTLIDLDDLERLCPVDLSVRRHELDQAESAAAGEASAIARWVHARAAVPAILALRQRAAAIRDAELARAAPKLKSLTPEQQAAVDRLTHAIVQKLLHEPLVRLRDSSPPRSAEPALSQSKGARPLPVHRPQRLHQKTVSLAHPSTAAHAPRGTTGG